MPVYIQEAGPAFLSPIQETALNTFAYSESLVTNILRRITPAANSVCTSMQFIRGYIKYTTYDQHLLAHWIRIISLPVADAALCDPLFLRELLLAHPTLIQQFEYPF